MQDPNAGNSEYMYRRGTIGALAVTRRVDLERSEVSAYGRCPLIIANVQLYFL